MNETLIDLKKIVDVTKDNDIKDPGLLRPVVAAINDVLVKNTNIEIVGADDKQIVIGVSYNTRQKLQNVINDKEMCSVLAKLLIDVYAKFNRINNIIHNYNKTKCHQDKLYCKIRHGLRLISDAYRKENLSYFMNILMKREGARFWITDTELHLEIPLPDKELSVVEISNISSDVEQLMLSLQDIVCNCVEANQELDAIMSQMQ